ncbi:TlpA disulfide reductase family protein [Pedobacter sp. ok626]|uniref:TlpA family protein disulfide reductase n=1 Tax=Pedobacter sp. ok626 TaxID=1761882 RepID=UPI001404ECA5|nr:TlpA disulfide reductase family protein [Pedobacter sp. ok626]
MAIITQSLNAQEKKTEFKKVNVGEALPDYTLTNLIHYPNKSISFKDFKGKILILDFWSFGCAACIESWPKLMKLQQEYKDKIQIITVNIYNKEREVIPFIKRFEKIGQYTMTLPVACGDKNLKTLFPFESVPHVVIIDKEGKLKYVTEGYNLNSETINGMLKEKDFKIEKKTDEFINNDEPLFVNGNTGSAGKKDNLLSSFMIAPYASEVFSIAFMSRKVRTKGFIGNYSIKDIFAILYGKGRDLRLGVRNSRIGFRDVDTTKIVMKVNGIIKNENRYTIQYIVPKPIPISTMKRQMIDQFETVIGYKARWEKQKKQCLVISRSDNPIPEYTGGIVSDTVYQTAIRTNGITMEQFITKINYFIPSFAKMTYPIVDESGFIGKLGRISINLTDDKLNYINMGKLLLEYGLKFNIEERETDILVISKNDIEPAEFPYP